MKIFNFGSVNIDHVYQVSDFVRPGETLSSQDYQQFLGGKGANQSIALARAGCQVFHVGKYNPRDRWIQEVLAKNQVELTHLFKTETPTGHAVIQVSSSGENSILLYGGANQDFSKEEIDQVLNQGEKGDWILLQNETNLVAYTIEQASKRGLKIVFNPAPMNMQVHNYPLDQVNYLILNEIEGEELSGKKEMKEAIATLLKRFSQLSVVLTLGKEGVLFQNGKEHYQVLAEVVQAVDTTAAGDTFIGYFIAHLSQNHSVEKSLQMACKAAAICVTRLGASTSIPWISEIIV